MCDIKNKEGKRKENLIFSIYSGAIQKKNKKAQEEMVGFVIIMLVVAVIFLIFLGIFLRQGGREISNDFEVSNFLDALEEHTTECTIDGFSYLNVRQIAVRCTEGSNSKCRNDKPACAVLEETLKEKTETAWNFNVNPPGLVKGYEYKLSYQPISGEARPLPVSVEGGRCLEDVTKRGAEKRIAARNGAVSILLTLCVG